MYAIIFAVKQFRLYIYGQNFNLVTDHRPLIWLCNLKDPTVGSRLARWKIKLQEYDYEIVYKPGRINANADALSRNPVLVSNSVGADESESTPVTDQSDPLIANVFSTSDTILHEYPTGEVESGSLVESCVLTRTLQEGQVGLSQKQKPSQGLRTLKDAAAIVEGLGHDSAGCTGRAGHVLWNRGTQPSLPREHEVALGLELEMVASKKAKMARGVKKCQN